MTASKILTLPEHQSLSIRAKALVFEDPASRALLEQAERVAASDASVLIFGETGTGKELIARHVHACSGRSGPFVAVNCGAFSETLVEAELFGHEAGAYTGATGARAGWFEAAQRGTLFLDEIGDLPLAMQVKLLRVLQERQVVRLGARKAIDIDVRLVAATNIDLTQAVEAGHFRRDLYYRLNIATLNLPPLAQRPADILALAEHFIAVYGKRLGLSGVQLSLSARAALLAHSWPGNIRELENVIHYALIIGKNAEIGVADLNLRAAVATVVVAQAAAGAEGQPGGSGLPALELLRRGLRGMFESGDTDIYAAIEREAIQAAYEFCHQNQVHTADLLGISRNVLRAQLKRFGFLPERGRRGSMLQGALGSSLHLQPYALAEEAAADQQGINSWAA
ncbi:MAG: sigma-54 interaction domain-containing protein [Leptothrix sp. (in: b-proteobacteria)]